MTADAVRTAVWARGEGVVLRRAPLAAFDAPEIRRALLDSIERGYDGEPEPIAERAERFVIEVARRPSGAGGAGTVVGVLAFERDRPVPGAVAVTTLAIAPGQRGHAYAARALLVLERRVAREAVDAIWARVPRGNGRGLYFVLRCGYAPVTPPPVDDGASWFLRNPALAPRLRLPAPPRSPHVLRSAQAPPSKHEPLVGS